MRHPSLPLVDQIRSLSRRGLLRGASASALLLTLTPAASRHVWANPVFAAYPFRLGVASGDPQPDGVVLWTRVAPDPLNGGGLPNRAVPVSWEVTRDERFATIVRRGETLARPELGHSVHVEVDGLEPGRPYWYRFRVGGEVSPTGRTRTAPAPDALPSAVRFANVGCQRYEDGYFTAYQHLAREELDFVFHYGDYIYEYRGKNDGVPRLQRGLKAHPCRSGYSPGVGEGRCGRYVSLPAPWLAAWRSCSSIRPTRWRKTNSPPFQPLNSSRPKTITESQMPQGSTASPAPCVQRRPKLTSDRTTAATLPIICSNGGGHQASAQQPHGGNGPPLAVVAPEHEVAEEDTNQEGDRERTIIGWIGCPWIFAVLCRWSLMAKNSQDVQRGTPRQRGGSAPAVRSLRPTSLG